MVYGKTQVTFRLLTEETAIKWRLPVKPGAATTYLFSAGQMVYMDKTNAYLQYMAADTALSGGYLIGIAMDTYTAALDETQGSGFATVVLGPHVGATSYFTGTGATTVIGAIVCNPLGTAGSLSVAAASSNTTRVAHALNNDGVFLTYFWVGV
jgi:hypothetical protein